MENLEGAGLEVINQKVDPENINYRLIFAHLFSTSITEPNVTVPNPAYTRGVAQSSYPMPIWTFEDKSEEDNSDGGLSMPRLWSRDH